MDIVICILAGIAIIISLINMFLIFKNKNVSKLSDKDKKDVLEGFNASIGVISNTMASGQKMANDAIVEKFGIFQDNLTKNQKDLTENIVNSEKALEDRVMQLIKQLDMRMVEVSKMQEIKLEQIKVNTENQIKNMQEDNNKQLDKMRETVDEKLSKTINERFDQSFKLLSNQLESVYKSLNEMQNISSTVDNLTKVLSNVKTTGILGEVQLGAILEQILTTDQYAENVVTANNHDPVEYAIKLPGQEKGEFVYLPIDSKFPLTVYNDLYTAYENNDADGVKTKKEQLKNTIRKMAKDINTKYIYPPKTTNFAIMFLPVEGLYAEVAKLGLIEELQEKYKITIAGPTTMSALLNSLQMGFKTLAIQKKSGEVWKILSAVKTEFGKFNDLVNKIRTKFENTSKDFDALVGTRTRMIASKLKSVETIDSNESSKVLGFEGITDFDDDDEN